MTPPRTCVVSLEAYPNLRHGVSEKAGLTGFHPVRIASGLRAQGWPACFVVGDHAKSLHEVIGGIEVCWTDLVYGDRSTQRSIANLGLRWRAMGASLVRHYALGSLLSRSFFHTAYSRLLGGRNSWMMTGWPRCLPAEPERLSKMLYAFYTLSLRWMHGVAVQTRSNGCGGRIASRSAGPFSRCEPPPR